MSLNWKGFTKNACVEVFLVSLKESMKGGEDEKMKGIIRLRIPPTFKCKKCGKEYRTLLHNNEMYKYCPDCREKLEGIE